MATRWLDALKEEVSKHNTAAASRERHNLRLVGPDEKLKTPLNPPSKTSNTTNEHKVEGENLEIRQIAPSKTSNTLSEAERLGLIATWSAEFGYVSIHDPTTGEWHDLPTREAPQWATWEARRRKELYREGNRRAYRLTSREMEEIWKAERAPETEGIVEEHPLEEEEE
jgi:hypothetical protein